MITAVSMSSPGWARTSDNSINSRVLCQLSYRGPAADATQEGYPTCASLGKLPGNFTGKMVDGWERAVADYLIGVLNSHDQELAGGWTGLDLTTKPLPVSTSRAQAQRALLAMVLAIKERYVGAPWAFGTNAAHLRWLEARGYGLSPVEQTLVE